MNMKRMGVFMLDMKTVYTNMTPLILKSIFSGMLIVRAEMMVAYDAIEYTAISDKFEVCENGYIIPKYEIVWEIVGDTKGSYRYKMTGFRKME